MNASTIVIIIIIGVILTCIVSGIGGGIYYQMYVVSSDKSILPPTFFFKKRNNTKFLGHAIKTINDIEESDCIRMCIDDPHCLGISYDASKKCVLQTHNPDTSPEFSTDWEGTINYAKIDPSSSVEFKMGYESSANTIDGADSTDGAHKNIVNASTLTECINICAGKQKDCLAANFYKDVGKCAFLTDASLRNTRVNPKSIFFYKKGLPSSNCKNNLDCMFGECKSGKCLVSTPLGAGSECSMNSDCQSGLCNKEEISYASQEEKRLKLLEANDIDAIECDKYNTCRGCEETVLKAGYSGGKCQWRTSTPYPKLKESQKCGGDSSSDNQSCPEGTICDPTTKTCICTTESCPTGCCSIDKRQCITVPVGGSGKCFPKTISTTRSICHFSEK